MCVCAGDVVEIAIAEWVGLWMDTWALLEQGGILRGGL